MMSGADAAAGTTTAVIAAVATATVLGIAAIKLAVKEHRETKLLERIKVINGYYHEHLERVKLPAIFMMTKDDKQKEIASSIILSEDVFRDIAQAVPAFSDSDLIRYGDYILQAMAGIRKFYQFRLKRGGFKQGKADDDTSNVLCYALLMLSTHCIKFSDYNVTLATIKALSDFILAFASIGNDENRARFKFLRPVHVILNNAHDHLKDHFLSLSLSEKLDLLIHNLADINKKMLRCLAKLLTPHNVWENIDWLMPDELALGIIKYEYEDTSLRSMLVQKEIKFKPSVFSDYVKQCAVHYQHAILKDDEGVFIKKGNFPPINLNQDPKRAKSKKAAAREAFKESTNFFTYKVNLPNSSDELLQDTCNNFHEEIWLTYILNISLFFLTHLERKVDTLGEVYVTDPHHCEFLFGMLNQLSGKLQQVCTTIYSKIDELNKRNDGYVMEINSGVFKEMYALLPRIIGKTEGMPQTQIVEVSINQYFKFLTDRHDERIEVRHIEKHRLSREVNVSNDPLLTIAFLITDVFELDTGFVAKVVSDPHNTPLLQAAVLAGRNLNRRGTQVKIVRSDSQEEEESPFSPSALPHGAVTNTATRLSKLRAADSTVSPLRRLNVTNGKSEKEESDDSLTRSHSDSDVAPISSHRHLHLPGEPTVPLVDVTATIHSSDEKAHKREEIKSRRNSP